MMCDVLANSCIDYIFLNFYYKGIDFGNIA